MFLNRKLSPQLILSGIVGVLALLVVFFTLASFLRPSSTQNPTRPSPTLTSAVLLNQQEKSYPEATPQTFQNSKATEKGTLVVNANSKGGIAKIDPLPIGETQGPKDLSSLPRIPDQTLPFIYKDIPSGQHTLLVSKPGYLAQKVSFTINPGQITRLIISLIPISQQ